MGLKHPELVVMLAVAALTVGCFAWYTRARPLLTSGTAPQPGERVAVPVGFSWNVQRSAYTRVNAAGELEAYATGVYL